MGRLNNTALKSYESGFQRFNTTLLLVLAVAVVASLWWFNSRGPHEAVVVVYTSQDQVYAEPIFEEFKKQTGIKVLAVFDSEAAKTVGLVNRLIVEKGHPQCDVFWNSEEMRTRQLAAQGMFRETNGWSAFGYRSRRLTINTNKLAATEAPGSWSDLTNANWHGKVALSYPLFGTSATHCLALRQHWGVEGWRNWCRAIAANNPLLVDGNSVAAQMVSKGEALVGITDSDDIAAENREGRHLQQLALMPEALLIPNTVGVIRSAPHPENAERFYTFLQQSNVVNELVSAHALEGASINDAQVPTLKPDWIQLLKDIEPATTELKQIFLR